MKKGMINALILFGLLLFASTVNSASIAVNLEGLVNSPDTNIYSVQMEFGVSVASGATDDWFNAKEDIVWDADQPILPVVVTGVGTFPRWSYGDIDFNSAKTKIIFLFEDPRESDFILPLINDNIFTWTYDDRATLSLLFYEFTAFNDDKSSLSELANIVPTTSALEFGAGDHTLTFAPPVPIPSSFLLLGGGILALLRINRKKAN